MIGMQYKIILPRDYDMNIIRNRVRDNGHKTDEFPGLYFKLYLITEAEKNGNLYNSYAPLYVWKNEQGMNKFIFEGFYDNILKSFGWKQINIGVPLSINLDKKYNEAQYVVEYEGNIQESNSLIQTPFNKSDHYIANLEKSVGELLIYNPDKWGYSHFRFFYEKPEIEGTNRLKVYEILHVSQN